MPSDEDLVRMRHMLDAATEAVALSGRRGPKALAKNRVLSLALVRLLEVLGEAAGRVSERTRGEHPEVHGHRSWDYATGSSMDTIPSTSRSSGGS